MMEEILKKETPTKIQFTQENVISVGGVEEFRKAGNNELQELLHLIMIRWWQ